MRGLRGVLDDGFEDIDVLEEPAPSFVGDAAEGLRPFLVVAFPDLDQAGLVQDLEVPAQVAVGQVAEFFQVREDNATGLGDQRGHDAEPCFFVEDALEAIVSDTGRSILPASVLWSDMISLQRAIEHERGQNLAGPEGKAHRPRG